MEVGIGSVPEGGGKLAVLQTEAWADLVSILDDMGMGSTS